MMVPPPNLEMWWYKRMKPHPICDIPAQSDSLSTRTLLDLGPSFPSCHLLRMALLSTGALAVSPLLSNVTYHDRHKSAMQLRLPFLSNAVLNTVSGFSVHVMSASSHRSLIRKSPQYSIMENRASFSETQYTLHEHQMYGDIGSTISLPV